MMVVLKFRIFLLYLSFKLQACIGSEEDSVSLSRSKWELLAHPEVIVPGEESVIFLKKDDSAEKRFDNQMGKNSWKGNFFTNLSSSLTIFSPIEASQLVATLALFDGNSREIFRKMWRADANQGLVKPRSEIETSIFPVPLRVPAHFGDGFGFIPGSTGQVQIRDDEHCRDEPSRGLVCSDECRDSCINVDFKIVSRLRQVVVFTPKTDYIIGEEVEVYYQPIDEMTLAKDWPMMTLWLEDATGSILYEWRMTPQVQKEQNGSSYFRKISYPLGEKATLGNWRACATSNPWVEESSRKKTSDFDEITDCFEFKVVERKVQPSVNRLWERRSVPTRVEEKSSNPSLFESPKNKVEMSFGPEMKKSFPRNVPISGRLLSSAPENEVEVSVQLIESNHIENSTKIIGEQVLLLNDEAIFEFPAIGLTSTDKNYSIEARLLTISEPWRPVLDEPENLEIIEEGSSLASESRSRNRIPITEPVVVSKMVQITETNESKCPLWTQGLQRAFKSGDRATVSVISSCPCEKLGAVNWIVSGRSQFLAWGTQEQGILYETDSQINRTLEQMCQYNFNIEITSRMFPSSKFKVWLPQVSSGSFNKGKIPQKVQNEIPNGEFSFEEQDIVVSFHDRTMAILETNVTEVRHRDDKIGVEVFAEPYSSICLMGSQWNNDEASLENEKRGLDDSQKILPFRIGKLKWFMQCGNASDDGFYSLTVSSPPGPGRWLIEAISVSSLHGLRVSNSKLVTRSTPVEANLFGLPEIVKRDEIIRDVNLVFKNRAQEPLQVKLKITGSSDDVSIIGDDSLNDFSTYNISALETTAINFTIGVGNSVGLKNITVQLSIYAFRDHKLIEFDAITILRTFDVRPRGMIVTSVTNDYFCSNENQQLVTDPALPGWKFFPVTESTDGAVFMVTSSKEIVLSVQSNNSKISYEIVIGSEDNSVSWISMVKNGKEKQRLQTLLTPNILVEKQPTHFWLSWKSEDALIKFGNGGLISENILFAWPMPTSFKPTRIGIKDFFFHQNQNIRFWSIFKEGSREIDNDVIVHGHNKVFSLVVPTRAVNGSFEASYILTSDFQLPTHRSLMPDEIIRSYLTSFESVLETLRDAATIAIYENFEPSFTSVINKQEITKSLHQTMQELFYFRNVDGSFGEPLLKESFSLAMEQLYLMNEIQRFYDISPKLISGLQRWILRKARQVFESSHDETELETISLDILEWAPIESMIFQKFAPKSFDVVKKSLRSRLDNGFEIVGLSRHVATLMRASGLAAGDFISPTPANAALTANVNFTDKERDQDTFITEILNEMLSYLSDILNCELAMKEDEIEEQDEPDGHRKNSHDVRHLVYVLLAFAHSRPVKIEPEKRLDDIFRCLHTHGNHLLQSTQVGYTIVRALSEYHLSSRNLENLDLKVSVGLEMGSAHTYHMGPLQQDMNFIQYAEKIALQRISESNKKFYFLATGNGCATFQLTTKYETFEVEEGPYEVAMDIYENLDEDELVFVTVCIKLAANSPTWMEAPTTLLIDFFSGFEFESMTELNFLNLPNFLTNGWKYSGRNQLLKIHLKEIRRKCGSCFTAKFRRKQFIENLSPVKFEIRPTSLEIGSRSTTTIFFHSNKTSSQLRNGVSYSSWMDWTSLQNTDSNGAVVSSQSIRHICPCSVQCETAPRSGENEEDSTKSVPVKEQSTPGTAKPTDLPAKLTPENLESSNTRSTIAKEFHTGVTKESSSPVEDPLADTTSAVRHSSTETSSKHLLEASTFRTPVQVTPNTSIGSQGTTATESSSLNTSRPEGMLATTSMETDATMNSSEASVSPDSSTTEFVTDLGTVQEINLQLKSENSTNPMEMTATTVTDAYSTAFKIDNN